MRMADCIEPGSSRTSGMTMGQAPSGGNLGGERIAVRVANLMEQRSSFDIDEFIS
jgi:hypothetical protein